MMETIELNRDCDAIQIPEGTTVTLGKGTPVDITQTLGGTYTVRAGHGLFRIGANDADALGLAAETERIKVLLPALGSPSKPTSANTFSSSLRSRRSPSEP